MGSSWDAVFRSAVCSSFYSIPPCFPAGPHWVMSAFPSALFRRELVVLLNISSHLHAASQGEAPKDASTLCHAWQDRSRSKVSCQLPWGSVLQKTQRISVKKKNHKSSKDRNKWPRGRSFPWPRTQEGIQSQGSGGEGGTSCNT